MVPMDAIWLDLVKTELLPTTSWLPTHPPPSHLVGVLLVLAAPVKNYLKWLEIQLAIHPRVGEQIDYKQLYDRGKFHLSISFPSRVIVLQIIKIGISKYLQLCVEGGKSQIRSQIFFSEVSNILWCIINEPVNLACVYTVF